MTVTFERRVSCSVLLFVYPLVLAHGFDEQSYLDSVCLECYRSLQRHTTQLDDPPHYRTRAVTTQHDAPA